MRISDLAIKYRTSIVVLTLLLVLGGIYSYNTIPKEAQPSIEIPNIVVTTIYPGASPDDIESLVTQEIEREIQGINGIKDIRSTSTEGVSTIIVEFEPDVSMDDAFQKVRDKVDVAKADLPDDVEEPIVSEIDFSEFPILTINMAGSYSLARLKEVAEDLQEELEAIPSVLEVDLIGGLEREVQVNVDLNALQGYNITFNDVVAAIQSENTNFPGGSIDVDRLNYLVRVDGEIDDPAEIQDLVVKAPNGQPIYVRDVAEVIFGFKERGSYARLQVFQKEDENGDLYALPEEETRSGQVISLNVKKRTGDNILETVDEVNEALAAFPFPNGTQVVITGDQSEFVVDLIADLENNIISGLFFVVAVLLFFLGVRNAVLVGIAIPMSMFISFIVFQALGYTLNFIILFSLIIALGMLVDNAIVIIENIYRFVEEGHSKFEAAKLGTREVAGAVVASTATTVAVFVPMLFWPGIIGEFMGYLPLTLIVTLICSLFVALIINPVLTGIFVKLDSEETPPMRKLTKTILTIVIVVLAIVLGVASWETLVVLAVGIPLLYFIHTRLFKPVGDRFVNEGLPNLVTRYRAFLDWMLKRAYPLRERLGANKSTWIVAAVLGLPGYMLIGQVMNPEQAPNMGEPMGTLMMQGGMLLMLAAVIWLLVRIKNSMFRNTFALGSFTLGVVLSIIGAVIGSAAGEVAAMPVQMPAFLFLLAGVLGIVFHLFESMFAGGLGTTKFGLLLLLIFGGVIGLLLLGGTEIAPDAIGAMLGLPAVIVVVGVIGWFFKPDREWLILSDNRARLTTGAIAALFIIIGLFRAAPTGVEFFPETDPNQVRITAEGPLGMNLEASDRIAQTVQDRINQLLDENPEVKANVQNMLVNVGVGGDADFGGGSASPERSRVTLNMVEYAARAEPSTVTMEKLRAQLKGIPGASIQFDKDQNGPPTGAPVNIEITGPDFDQIVRISKGIKQRLVEASETGAIPGLVDIADNLNTGRPELRVNIDRERAAQFGLNTSKIGSTVRSAINGFEAGKYRTGEDEYDITVRLEEADRASLESLNNLTILDEGVQIPLVSVAELEISGGLGSVTRLDLARVATVTGQAAPGANAQAILGQVQGHLAEYVETLPPGYIVSYTGENEEQQESFGFLTTVLLIGVSLIFMIMVAQFNKVSLPFIIMVAVGLSLIGVLLGLILTRTPFGLMTFIGVISLAGIVVNNNIVLVDYTMQLRDRGLSKHDAIIEAGATRLRPVLLTALTTVLGLIPLTFGLNIDFVGLLTNLDPNFQFGSENTQFWGPMGTAIISGLTFATFLTLVIVPVLYSVFDSLSSHLSEAFSRKPVTHTVDPEQALVPAPAGALPAAGDGANGATEARPVGALG